MACKHNFSGMTGISVIGRDISSPSKYVPHDSTETSSGTDSPATDSSCSTRLSTLALA